MNELQVDLADMKAFGGKPYPFMLVAIDALTKKVAAEPLKDRLASTTAAGMKKVFQPGGAGQRVLRRRLRVQEGVQGADGFLGHGEAGARSHAYFAERIIRTIKEAMLRRIAAGAAGGGSGTLCWPTS